MPLSNLFEDSVDASYFFDDLLIRQIVSQSASKSVSHSSRGATIQSVSSQVVSRSEKKKQIKMSEKFKSTLNILYFC